MTIAPSAKLFEPFQVGSLTLANRTVMAPMTRCFAPDGVVGLDVAGYYRRRAEGGVGLIVTEGTWIDHPSASNEDRAPRFHGDDALQGWRHVVEEVHGAGGRIVPQLWHVGMTRRSQIENLYDAIEEDLSLKSSPSGYLNADEKVAEGSSEADIIALIEAYAKGAKTARALGFDGVELHGTHGYLIDQFLWHGTNRRTDGWGGPALADRARFAVEVVRACRREVGPDFPIIFRFSQWKQQDYNAKRATTPDELATLLEPLADAGVDIFHASQRRFWETAFAGSPLNLAGWARKLTGRAAITVGSLGIEREMLDTMFSGAVEPSTLGRLGILNEMLERGDFDLVGIGRSLLVDPLWVDKVRRMAHYELQPYSPASLASLS
ncbi:12-oxophytodienoate reductase [Sphingobium lactosutens]|uniref:NADH:flavin oxidoreductase n=1 Tax=Sphingobium lactosutens TaxID=522773 RepID=UPI0015BA5CC9|nr:NADH:flavin oxidoreductase [Sphingobium lactosutens]NWK97904.1 12-oxophytodienoate reductase [Sphingobium lactosutens]